MGNGTPFASRLPAAEEPRGSPLQQRMPASEAPAQGKVRIAYITSPRELEGEGVGYDSRVVPTLQFLLDRIRAGDRRLANAEIAAVVVDDDGTERRGRVPGSGSGSTPSETFEFLRATCEQAGINFHVEPSAGWRTMRSYLDAEKTIENPVKHEAKMEYEMRLLHFMRENKIDVILSDSYVVIFNSVMLSDKMGYPGLIINVHPAIASEIPGITPTRDALMRATYFTGKRVGSQPKEAVRLGGRKYYVVPINEGNAGSVENVFAKLQGHGRDVAACAGSAYIASDDQFVARASHGATLHEVDEMIDHGPAILVSSGTPIRKGDSQHDLRIRNYATKNNTVLHGLPMFLGRERTQQLICENRVKNAAFRGERLSEPGAPLQRRQQPRAARMVVG